MLRRFAPNLLHVPRMMPCVKGISSREALPAPLGAFLKNRLRRLALAADQGWRPECAVSRAFRRVVTKVIAFIPDYWHYLMDEECHL